MLSHTRYQWRLTGSEATVGRVSVSPAGGVAIMHGKSTFRLYLECQVRRPVNSRCSSLIIPNVQRFL